MSCPPAEQLLDAALGLLEADELAALTQHLEICAVCRAHRAALSAEQAVLHDFYARPVPSEAALEQSIIASMSSSPHQRRRVSPMKTIAIAAGLCLAVVGGVLAYRTQVSEEKPGVQQAQATEQTVPPQRPDESWEEYVRKNQAALEKAGLMEASAAEQRDELVMLVEAAERLKDVELLTQAQTKLRLVQVDKELGEATVLLDRMGLPALHDEGPSTEAYDRIYENRFVRAAESPLSTFSIDVDRASYANVRRFIQQGQKPPPDAVRIEELVNAFRYSDPSPGLKEQHPLAIDVQVAGCPWQPEHRLVRVALKGKELPAEQRPASNLVFLIDVSGSMNHQNKLPLVQKALRQLVYQLDERDSIAIVVYAGNAGLVLPPTSGLRQAAVIEALDQLKAGGSTNGGEGIELAYKTARENFIEGGINRVLIATDGDFNVGIADRGSLTRLIEEQADGGIFLSVLGFGMGNYKDATLEQLSNAGDGNYAYIDSMEEANKILGREMLGTLWAIARDVKLQLEFNPAQVNGYRLIGYENRILAHEDFNDDSKDAGDLGVGHSVIAFYQVVPAGVEFPEQVDPLKYGPAVSENPNPSPELLTAKLRYQLPADDAPSQLLEVPVIDTLATLDTASDDFKFSAAVAAFGLILRDSAYKGGANWGTVQELASEGLGEDADGERARFLVLVAQARDLSE